MNLRRNMNSSLRVSPNLYCFVCNSQYFIRDLTLRKSRCPLLLNCGHSICATCLWQKIKTVNVVTCGRCSVVSTLMSIEDFHYAFPLSKYLTGSAVLLQSFKSKRVRGLTVDYEVKEESNSKQEPRLPACEECSLTRADWYCGICRSNFCEMCWKKIHGYAKSLMKHVKYLVLNNKNENLIMKKCPNHDTQNLEFYCRGCKIIVCPHCIISEHQGEGHCPVTLKEKNVEMVKKIKAAAEDAEVMSNRMRHTLQEIRDARKVDDTSDSCLELEKKIAQNFAFLHGILQVEEDRLTRALQGKTHAREERMDECRARVESHLEVIGKLLSQSEAFLENPDLWNDDVTELHGKLLDVRKLPCRFVSGAAAAAEARATFDDSVPDSLRNFCTLELPPDEVCRLVSRDDDSGDSDVEVIECRDCARPRRDREKADGEASLPDLENYAARIAEGENYSVRVSYLKSPGEFFVTLNSQSAARLYVDSRAAESAAAASPPAKLSKDAVYLVQCGDGQTWRRARALEVSADGSSGEVVARVSYLDFGNSERVPVSRTRPASEDLEKLPPLAIKCKLFDCLPNGGEWCPESTRVMEDILEGSTVTMFVMKTGHESLEVDLGVVGAEGQIATDFESIRDALVFLEFTTLVRPTETIHKTKPGSYASQSFPPRGESFDAVVTHVYSPDEFYVQRVQDLADAHELSLEMQNYYERNPQKGIIYNPRIGMPCAAFFLDDKKWCRGKIVGVPGRKMVTVFYVDCGNTRTVPWTSIRKLKQVFFAEPPLAFSCSLAGIQPKSTHWSPKAKGHLMSLMRPKTLRLHVHGTRSWKESQNLKVSLFEVTGGGEVCVNSAFVEMGYAVSFSSRMMLARGGLFKNAASEGEDRARRVGVAFRALSVADGEALPLTAAAAALLQKSSPRMTAAELRALHAQKKASSGDPGSACGKPPQENDVDTSDGIFKVRVQVVSAKSPSCVYVTLSGLAEMLQKLRLQMNEHYERTLPEEEARWEAGSKCAVRCPEDDCWYRGQVLGFVPDRMVKVFLSDAALSVTVLATSLRRLDSSFSNYPVCAAKCHLSDVAPVGGTWPNVSCEFFSLELERHNEIYMSRKGDIENESLPVELWVHKIESRGALDPTTKRWFTLNQLLVEQGLAVPITACVACPGPSSWGMGFVAEPMPEANAEEERAALDGVLPLSDSKWPPPEPLKNSRFIGRPTYVDFDGCIYIHDVERDDEKLQWIRNTLLEDDLSCQVPPAAYPWRSQEACFVRFHVDDFWYRGLVVKANEDRTYEVLFVDYGNVETCQASDLKKANKMTDVPVLTHKFRLQGIVPVSGDGSWPTAVLEILHSLVVEKICDVNVLVESLDPRRPSSICLKVLEYVEVDVGEFLVKEGLAQFRDDFARPRPHLSRSVSTLSLRRSTTEPRAAKQVPESLDGAKYDTLVIPEDCKGLVVKITIPASKVVVTNLVDHESLAPRLRQVLKEFEAVKRELAEQCPSQPRMEKFWAGRPCCCFDPVLQEWSRGEVEIFRPTNETVDVVLVDTGFKEVLDLSLVSECKPEWLRVPKMAVRMRIPPSGPDFWSVLSPGFHNRLFYAEILKKHEDYFEATLSRVEELKRN